jgi:hypothetical protein
MVVLVGTNLLSRSMLSQLERPQPISTVSHVSNYDTSFYEQGATYRSFPNKPCSIQQIVGQALAQ